MHKDDKDFIDKQIKSLPDNTHMQHALIKYREVFDAAFEREPIPNKKTNAARREANTRLRIFCEKVNK